MPPLSALAAAAALSAAPQIEIYTMGQGAHLFERFGHAAICVEPAAAPERTLCYNYGSTDFGSPPQELGWRFLRGDAEFWVSVWPRDRMLQSYARADRSVWRQRLALPPEQARAVAAKLAFDAREENKRYLYHHFDDNCSTRVRDVLNASTGERLAPTQQEPLGTTFRRMGRKGLAAEPAALAVGDLLVGRRADEPLSVWQGMFHPDILRAQIQRHYASSPVLVAQRRGPDFRQTPPRASLVFAAVGAVFAAVLLALRARPRAHRIAAAAVGVLLALVALVPWVIAGVSTVPELRGNELLLVLWPSDLLLALLAPGARRGYARVRLFALALSALLAATGVLRQPVLPFVVLVALPMALLALWPEPRTSPAVPAAD